MANEQGSHWFIESNMFHLCVTYPPEICVHLVIKHIRADSSYTMCKYFVPFIY